MPKVLRVILDTSIYGRIVFNTEDDKIRNALNKNRNIIIYGSRIIRGELRETPKILKDFRSGRKIRILLLNLYDSIARHNLPVIGALSTLAREYYRHYRLNGGSLGWKYIENDFLIVATASFYNLDIVVSEDERTMKSEPAVKAYLSVNDKERFNTPKFIDYEEFKKIL
jgi:predicted nucleic acid-binding protein